MIPSRNVNGMEISHTISAVKDNRKGYTQQQFEPAKEARQIYHIIFHPTIYDLKHLLIKIIINNFPVVINDVNLADKCFGPDIGALKVKSTSRKPKLVKYGMV